MFCIYDFFNVMSRAAESTDFERLRLPPENMNSDPILTPVWQMATHPKTPISFANFLALPFGGIQTMKSSGDRPSVPGRVD